MGVVSNMTKLTIDYDWLPKCWDANQEVQMYLDAFFTYPERICIKEVTCHDEN